MALQKVQGWAEQGGGTVVSSGVSSTTKEQASFPGSTVTVYNAGTLTLSTIASDSGGTPKANPFTVGSDGYWFFYVANGNYDIRFSGTGITVPFTLGDISVGGGASSTVAAVGVLGTVQLDQAATDPAHPVVPVANSTLLSRNILTTKGDLLGWSTTLARTPAPTVNGTLLTADSTAATGMSWQPSSGGEFNVASKATGGLGTFASPWTGWDTAITWTARTTYNFPSGVYQYSASPNFAKPGIRLIGTGQTFLKYTGSGFAIDINGTTYSPGGYIFDVEVADMTIDGGTTATAGLRIQSVHHSRFKNIEVRNLANASGIAYFVTASVLNSYEDLQLNGADDAQAGWPGAGGPALTTHPQFGMLFITGSAGILGTIGCNSSTIINPNIAGATSHGINSNGLISSTITGGAIELNGGYGIFLQGGEAVSIEGTELEYNTSGGIRTSACTSMSVKDVFMFNNNIIVDAGVRNCVILGGTVDGISNSGAGTKIIGVTYGYSGGSLADAGSFTYIFGAMTAATGANANPFKIANKSVTAWKVDAAGNAIPHIYMQGHFEWVDTFGLGNGANIISYDPLYYPPTGSTTTANWRMIFKGSWYSVANGVSQVQPATIVELTKASPTLGLGAGLLFTAGLFTGTAYPAAASNSSTIGFNGTIEIIADDFNVASTSSLAVKGSIRTSGAVSNFSKGADVASAAAITPTGNLFHVTGTTNITSITSTGIDAGTRITIIFDGALTFTDGSNLKLAGNFVTTADDTITLLYDGTNWYEVCRSVN